MKRPGRFPGQGAFPAVKALPAFELAMLLVPRNDPVLESSLPVLPRESLTGSPPFVVARLQCSKTLNRIPVMDMSAEEIKQFWRGYCERRKVAKDVVAKGEKKIDEDPQFWADQTMDELLKLVA